MEKLKDLNIPNVFEAKVGGKNTTIKMIPDDINTLTDNMSEVLFEVAMEVLGKKEEKNRPWVTNFILDSCDGRNKLKK